VSSPVLSVRASFAARAGTFPGLSRDALSAAGRLSWSPSSLPPIARRAGVIPKTSPQRETAIVAETSAAELADDMLDRLAAMPVAPVAHVYVEGRRGEVMAAFDEKEERESNA